MSDVRDLRAAVLALASVQERAMLRPAAYEVNPPTKAITTVRNKRVRLPPLGPFIATGVVTSVSFTANYSIRIATQAPTTPGQPVPAPRSICEGDIDAGVLPVRGAGLGDYLAAPFYVDDTGALILETISDVVDNGNAFGILIEGFHAPQSLVDKCRKTLGEAFLVQFKLVAGDDTPTPWEVPEGDELVLDGLHDLSGQTLTAFELEVAGVQYFPRGVTNLGNMFGDGAGEQSPELHMALRGGDSIVATPTGLGANWTFYLNFARF